MIKDWRKSMYRILFNKSTSPLVGAKTLKITREASFCQILDRNTALDPPNVLSIYKHFNDVHTSGTLYAHTRYMLDSKIFGIFEILLKNLFCSVCAYNVPDDPKLFLISQLSHVITIYFRTS